MSRRSSLILTPDEFELADKLKREADARIRKALSFHRVTAEIIYYRPDHPLLLQSFVHQFDDVLPELMRVNQFLEFWRRELTEAPINQVRVTCGALTSVSDFRHCLGDFRLN